MKKIIFALMVFTTACLQPNAKHDDYPEQRYYDSAYESQMRIRDTLMQKKEKMMVARKYLDSAAVLINKSKALVVKAQVAMRQYSKTGNIQTGRLAISILNQAEATNDEALRINSIGDSIRIANMP